jgi:predicted NAD-dependent protein-ADP-ribosyltransferase YbiA (DUF1768 family)
MKSQDFYDFLVREEAYEASSLNCFAFRHGYDVRQGLSLSLGNMVRGFGFDLQGIHFHNSECAYIAGAFSYGTNAHLAIQRQLVVCNNGYAAKKTIRKPHDNEKRADWETFNVEWMKYVVWQKCLGNEDFRGLLLSFPKNAVIIEDSTFQKGSTATVWGTRNDELKKRLNHLRKELKAQGMCKAAIKREQDRMRLGEWSTTGIFRGQNLMGKILMVCKQALEQGAEPPIDYALLQDAHINLLGRELTFNQYVKAA